MSFLKHILVLAVFIFGIVSGCHMEAVYREHLMKMEADLIDNSLHMWSLSKRRPEDGMMKDTYPVKLSELSDIPYPSDERLCRILSFGHPVYVHRSRFRYQTKTEADGSMVYKLEVILPNGRNFKSQGSKF